MYIRALSETRVTGNYLENDCTYYGLPPGLQSPRLAHSSHSGNLSLATAVEASRQQTMPTIKMQSRFIGIGGIDDIFDLEIRGAPGEEKESCVHTLLHRNWYVFWRQSSCENKPEMSM